MLEPGTTAPIFEVKDQFGQPVKLADYLGRWLVLWWYPKANTEGCSLEGAMFRSSYDDFVALDAEVLGISFDLPEDNCVWSEISEFPFRLLSDPDHAVGSAYEVEREQGDRFAGMPKRITYLIDPEGVIRESYEVAHTDISSHPHSVLADLGRFLS
tara:strand:+ start:315 stop:782 length:468 start_codon:yes stop_codon:yes gene_type:complete